jgi:hypothetical protein
MLNHLLFTIAAIQARAIAQSCGLSNSFPAPLVADGYEAHLIAQGLTRPRGIIFDDKNNLLVVERGVGITSFMVDGSGNCVNLKNKKIVVSDGTVSFLTFIRQKTLTRLTSSTMVSSSLTTAKPSTPPASNPSSNTSTTPPSNPLLAHPRSSSTNSPPKELLPVHSSSPAKPVTSCSSPAAATRTSTSAPST